MFDSLLWHANIFNAFAKRNRYADSHTHCLHFSIRSSTIFCLFFILCFFSGCNISDHSKLEFAYRYPFRQKFNRALFIQVFSHQWQRTNSILTANKLNWMFKSECFRLDSCERNSVADCFFSISLSSVRLFLFLFYEIPYIYVSLLLRLETTRFHCKTASSIQSYFIGLSNLKSQP